MTGYFTSKISEDSLLICQIVCMFTLGLEMDCSYDPGDSDIRRRWPAIVVWRLFVVVFVVKILVFCIVAFLLNDHHAFAGMCGFLLANCDSSAFR